MLHRRMLLWLPAFVAVAAYWDDAALHGNFVYDDVACVLNNEVVTGGIRWWPNLFARDFWGSPMAEPKSHKSYRPLTTLSLKLNWILAERLGTKNTPDHAHGFRVVNVVLHGVATGLVAEVASFVFGTSSGYGSSAMDTFDFPSLAVGLLFGLHPVHAEAVSNVTGRGELLMTVFFCLAFLSYAGHTSASSSPPSSNSNTSYSKSKSSVADGQAVCPANGDKGGGGGQMGDGTDRSAEKIDGGGDVSLPTKKMSAGSVSGEEGEGPPVAAESSSSPIYLRMKYGAFVYTLPCLFMALSLFSKEQGATTLCSLVAYDFIYRHVSLKRFVADLLGRGGNDGKGKESACRDFLKRTAVLAAQTLAVVGVRYWLNGASSPHFVHEQNPAGFAKDRFQRVFTVNWIYCLYLRDMVYPAYLAPDWSGDAIPLVKSLVDDKRAWCVIMMWLFVAGCAYSLLFGGGDSARSARSPAAKSAAKEEQSAATAPEAAVAPTSRQVFLAAFFAFMCLPFFLSSNLLVTTGFAKADRVVYLPLLGFCLMEALLLKVLIPTGGSSGGYNTRSSFLVFMALFLQLSMFATKTQERNSAWGDELTLWTKAFEVNPISLHTRSNAGRVLAKSNQWERAEEVLRPIKDARETGYPNDTFLYTVSLSKFDRCVEAHELIDDAIKYIHELRGEGGLRYNERMSLHEESSLMISRAFCTKDIPEKGRIMREAVTLDPQNSFAASSFQNYVETVQRMEQQQQQMMQGGGGADGSETMQQQQMKQMIGMLRQPGGAEKMLQMMMKQGISEEDAKKKIMHMMQQQQGGAAGGGNMQQQQQQMKQMMGMLQQPGGAEKMLKMMVQQGMSEDDAKKQIVQMMQMMQQGGGGGGINNMNTI